MFGENLVLKRSISTSMGARSFHLKDTIVNNGFKEEPLKLMYHINFGYPLLDAVSKVVIPSKEVRPNTESSVAGLKTRSDFEAPSDSYQKQSFNHLLVGDSNGNTCTLLFNPELQIGAYIKCNVAQFPSLSQWKTLVSGDYALGLEPINAPNLSLAPQEQMEYELELGIADGSEEISALSKWIESLVRT
jgi:hypothetical protein